MEYLYEKLKKYNNSEFYPFHMPGHKRNSSLCHMENPYNIDITEIEGFDNLHMADGILKKAMDRAANLYGSEKTYFLINGSTSGILAGISACTKKGDKILMARNCHKSVYNAVFINELKPVYIYPRVEETFGINGGISADKIEELLIKNNNIKLVVITSPTYEGILSDIDKIAKVVHKYNIPLLVDEAHGSHLGFGHGFPENSIKKGADIVIHSIHKTLPAFTQTALIHINGKLVNKKRLEKYLSIYQTSSPSYILMAGIDNVIKLLKEKGEELFNSYKSELDEFYKNTKNLKKLKILRQDNIIWEHDSSKIVISVKNTEVTGSQLCDILRSEYSLEMEMASRDYIIAMTGLGDTSEGLKRLSKAINEIDKKIKNTNDTKNENITYSQKIKNICPDIAYSASEAENKKGIKTEFQKSQGKVSKEYAFLYPPGIPLIVPGEIISREILDMLLNYKKSGLEIKGLDSEDLEYIITIQK